MPSHLLSAGTLLDGRYRIDSVLGEGGFGITYAAENLRIGLRVAIKELFWRGYSVRSAEDFLTVGISDGRYDALFQEHKSSFLREARIIRDFSDTPGVAHIMDYFEANGTAYIVMEYIEGKTLAACLKERPRIPAQELFARFLPLAESLGRIHTGGVIHRDISPDNIIVRPDGSMVLIDFGAARVYRSEGGARYTTIAKESFAPGEQYDRNGRQGPWTDVYALCATLYACVAGFPPVSSVQRMFLDELEKPSQLGVSIAPEYEDVIMKGLEMTAARRHADMNELAEAMKNALPKPAPARSRARSALIGCIAGLLCAALALGLWYFHENRAENKFRGVETETFWLTAPGDMTAAAFAQMQADLTDRLEAFAGADGYLMTVQGDRLEAEVPLDAFGGREIYSVLKEEFLPLVDGKRYHVDYELKADWEDPKASLTPGKNQVSPASLEGKTALLSYGWSEALTPGQRANLLMDFKVRLDALDTPYAFGTLYGDPDTLVIRIGADRLSQFVLDSLGSRYSPLSIAGGYSGHRISFSRSSYGLPAQTETVRYDDGTFGVRCRFLYEYEQQDLTELTEALARCGEDVLYLQSANGYALAEIPLADVADPSCIEFRHFRFEGLSAPGEAERFVVDYVDALVNQTELPASCRLEEARMLDEQGEMLPGESLWDHYGLRLYDKECDAALMEALRRFTADRGAEGRAGDFDVQIQLNLDVDERLMERFTGAIASLLTDYGLRDMIVNPTVEIVAFDEQPGESCRVTMNTTWSSDRGRRINDLDCFISTDGRLAPYAGEFIAWWESIDPETWGVTAD